MKQPRNYTLCRYKKNGLTEPFRFTAKNHAEALLTVSDLIQESKDPDQWTRVWLRCDTHMNYIYDSAKN